MDKEIRNRIQRATQDARALLEREYAEQLEGVFDIRLDGTMATAPGAHLDAEQCVVRDKLVAAVEHRRAGGFSRSEAVAAYRREAAFTTLNRFVALKMLEARGLVQECLSRGEQSSGFKEFTGLAPGLVQLPDHGYRIYIESLFDEIGREVRVLFDRRDPASLLWPRRQALVNLLDVLNAAGLAEVWKEDETIGWVYQYFNSDVERRQMRDESQVPRNSRELAVRNQFFTPRYVVEFLTDNTLGRIWYEMRQGKTRLIDECDYLVRRPTETFLANGEGPHPSETDDDEELRQEELLKKPVYIPFRPQKDPRGIKVLDLACGSGHFLLYAFDLLVTIYEEGWEDEAAPKSELTGCTLGEDYASLDTLHSALPGLILRHNLHGIDIDPRAAQIAALALWMRAQRTYNNFGIARGERPPITRTNTVVAEPMPGEKDLRQEFVTSLAKQLGQLVERVFEKMELAGEAGSLLKIEDEIQSAIRDIYGEHGEIFQKMDEERWWEAEEQLLAALQRYAEQTQNGHAYRRRLFAEDAVRGFAFIDLCRQRYDVVLMNPPFGFPTDRSREWFRQAYTIGWENLLCASFQRGIEMAPHGFVGGIYDATWAVKKDYSEFRDKVVLHRPVICYVHLGWGVLDANVETNAVVCGGATSLSEGVTSVFNVSGDGNDRAGSLFREVNRAKSDEGRHVSQRAFINAPNHVILHSASESVARMLAKGHPLPEALGEAKIGMKPADNFRFIRLHWEVASSQIGPDGDWQFCQNGSPYSPFHFPCFWVARRSDQFHHLSSITSSRTSNSEYYGRPGLTYGKRTDWMYAYVMPAQQLFTNEGQAVFSENEDRTWTLLGLLNSSYAQEFINQFCGQHKESGYVNQLRVPPTLPTELGFLARTAHVHLAELDMRLETSPDFRWPLLPEVPEDVVFFLTGINAEAEGIHGEINRLVESCIGARTSEHAAGPTGIDYFCLFFGTKDLSVAEVWKARISESLAYAIGRLDVRYANGQRPPPPRRKPFDSLPSCSPLLLTDDDELSAEAPHPDYPIVFPDNGVLVEDAGHEWDLVARVEQVFVEIGGEAARESVGAAVAMLAHGVSDIRGWFRNNFFDDHINRYSKSRRKAPIYWQLATPSVSYSVWLYYHRFTKDTFYKVLHDYVTPKLDHEERKLTSLVRTTGPNPTASQRKDIAEQEVFVEELRAFREEVARIRPLWSPDLNDGVIINFAPLWRLVPHHRAWQKECKDCWEKLVAGDYDWSHLAMHLWPERVVPKCAEDRSLAIAHGIEEVFWIKRADGKSQPRQVEQATLETLVQERTSAAVKEALKSLLEAPAPSGGRARGAGSRKGTGGRRRGVDPTAPAAGTAPSALEPALLHRVAGGQDA